MVNIVCGKAAMWDMLQLVQLGYRRGTSLCKGELNHAPHDDAAAFEAWYELRTSGPDSTCAKPIS